MQIWVDADACPKPIKEILFRAATRTGIAVTLIANQMLTVPRSPHIRAVQVPKGFDVADNEIARRVESGDLVITADIPLAADVIAKGGKVLTPRGEPYDKGSIAAALTMRNRAPREQLRQSQVRLVQLGILVPKEPPEQPALDQQRQDQLVRQARRVKRD
jgi:uncharacterized protein YaiI (UPF0178 family)